MYNVKHEVISALIYLVAYFSIGPNFGKLSRQQEIVGKFLHTCLWPYFFQTIQSRSESSITV